MGSNVNLLASIRASRGNFTLDLDLTVCAGRTLALLGPNGSGKSTALAAIAGVIVAGGPITLGERRLDGLEIEDRRVGYVFQDYLLFPHLTVLENVAFGPRSKRTPRLAARAAATDWLERLGIGELAQRRPAQLSGGQAQRVALARALAADPQLLLLDEPLSALDVEVRAELREELGRHLRQWGGLTIVVTHDFDDVTALADDVVVVERGRATQRGTVRELVRAPATAYVERLVASWPAD